MNSGRKESARIRKSIWYVSPHPSTLRISVYGSLRGGMGELGSSPGKGKGEGNSVQQDQSVSEMAQEVLMRQAMALAHRSGHSLEDAHQAVSDTEAGRQLEDLAMGEHGHKKASEWQVSMFWDRAEKRFMHQVGSEALSHFEAERGYSWVESDIERLEGKEERAR